MTTTYANIVTPAFGLMPSVTIIRTSEQAAREEEFTRTHVSRYVLPKKLDAAQAKGAASVSVPTSHAERLLARVGEHMAPITPDAPDAAPTTPAALEALPAELAGLMEWDAEGMAIVTREQIEALIGQAARMAHAVPRAARRKAPARTLTLPELVAGAREAGKANVSIPTADLERMLETVERMRNAARAERATVAA